MQSVKLSWRKIQAAQKKNAIRDRVGYFTDSRPSFGVFWKATVRRLDDPTSCFVLATFSSESITSDT
jgi:hypothetical protein